MKSCESNKWRDAYQIWTIYKKKPTYTETFFPQVETVFRIRIQWVCIRIRIQHFRLHSISIPIQLGYRVFMIENLKKFTALNKIFFFFIKIAIYLSLSLHKGCLSYRRSLQPSKENIQHFKTWNFLYIFSWVIFAFLDPDPDSGSGSTDLTGSGSETLVRKIVRTFRWPGNSHHSHRRRESLTVAGIIILK